MISHRFLSFIVVLVLASAANARSLKLADRHGEWTVTTEQLLGDPATRNVTIGDDPVYRHTVTYSAIPVPDLLRRLSVGHEDYVQFTAIDKFSVSVPAPLLMEGSNGPRAFLAIENPATPWPAHPAKGPESAGPFFLIWQDAKRGEIRPQYWVYRLAALEVTDSPYKRWPSLGVAEGLPDTHAARRGLELFVAFCLSCHRFKGAGAGEQGPDLGQPMNPVDYFQPAALRKLLRSSKQVRDWPNRKMPNFDEQAMSDEDIDAIISWLAYKARH